MYITIYAISIKIRKKTAKGIEFEQLQRARTFYNEVNRCIKDYEDSVPEEITGVKHKSKKCSKVRKIGLPKYT